MPTQVTHFTLEVLTRLLRNQITTLESVLKTIEQENVITDYANESLKRSEKNLRWMRKLILNNS